MFKEVGDARFPELEEEILAFWRERQIFKKSLEIRKGGPQYTFYEGPPTANGRPGVHHAQARSYKDLFPRYKTMRGYHVPRKAGWDCHGLPVELEVEKKLGLTSKREIEAYGIDRFNQACRESVFTYEQEWRRFTERIAYWVDLDDAYMTMSKEYVESIWWSLGELWKKGLLYRDFKVVPYCPRCSTPLSSHEVALGYKEIADPSIYVRFPLKAPERLGLEGRVSLLVWTTTPWTLPGNTAAAVHPEFTYAAFAVDGEVLILEEGLGRALLGEETPVQRRFTGAELKGLEYEPPYRFETPDKPAWFVVTAEFVTKEDGTGVVHQAPAFGAEDMETARAEGLPVLRTVDEEGKLTVGPWAGTFFRDANKGIIRDLRDRGLLFKREDYLHNYPHCWRCSTPLMYYATESWFIRNTAYKARLKELNRKIRWVPAHIQEGRYGQWLDNLVDWALSRNRYWGTPLPIWVCEACGHEHLVASYAELKERAREDVDPTSPEFDPHRPHVDRITLTCDRCGGMMRRVPYVIDVWYDSGAMPFAQHHYPFEAQEAFQRGFPADFIAEGIDQTRGWFNSLHQLGTMLFDSVAYRNVICHGLVLDEKGQKMSKSKGNVVDPWEIMNTFGADALRWYMYISAPPEADRRFGPSLVREVVRDYFLTLWNVYSFFVTYANLDKPNLTARPALEARPEVDRWLASRVQELIEEVTEALEAYDPTAASRALRNFVVEDLSQWYVRRNRRRFWKNADAADREAAYATLWEALVAVTHLTAPFTPYLAEALYQNLVRSVDADAPESVHLSDWPTADPAKKDEALLRRMRAVLKVVDLARAARARSGVKTRIPLPLLLVTAPTEEERAGLEHFAEEIADELNVKALRVVGPEEAFLTYTVKPNLPKLGPKYGRRVPAIRKVLAELDGQEVARAVREGRGVVLELDGEQIELLPEEVLVEAKAPEGYAALERNGYLAALEVRVDEALYLEGLAREMVRMVQQARKEMDLHVADRIRLYYEVEGRYAEALERFVERLKEETLVVSLEPVVPSGVYRVQVEDEDGRVVFGLRKA
ncbi:isoleucine--tRNA ligase [Marinithermus hydrothermalis]|uniref:Isoleucine--tRNA ligase n=1 Tax=Marinithermus hydrothermalis (strain DSM 14884 / JCM 11576 / T1) TaxID=869210 RepID=F2NQN4_MARHT|nr:isoleucine--tRNA ligase [Marinithermus hydrothermalis]AEB11972.1 Isoleucyl-tRNA synthetase [Marinithermus hydrothermalis DSM 14884]